MSLALKMGQAGEQVSRRMRLRRPAGRRPTIRRIVRGGQQLLRGVARARPRRRRRRGRGISAAELRGFRKMIRILANFTGIAPQRLARRVRAPRRRF